MTAVALALAWLVTAALAWDGWRRWLTHSAQHDSSATAELQAWRADMVRWREQLDNERRQEGQARAFGRGR